jgi:hypothetical protein
VALDVECDRAAAVAITGTFTITGKKREHGNAPTRTVTLAAIRIAVKAPRRPRRRLAAGARR